MATTRVIIKLDPSKVNPFLADVTDAASSRAANRVAARANSNVIAANRVRTGGLSRSYRGRQSRTAGGQYTSTYEVSSDLAHATLQEEGAGPSVAKPGGALRFMPKGSKVFIFRKRTRGFSGAHQLRNAYQGLSLRDYLP